MLIALLGWHYAVQLAGRYVMQAASGVGILSGLAAVMLGKSGDTGSGQEGGKKDGSQPKTWSLRVAAPVFCVVILVLLAHLNAVLARAITGVATLLDVPPNLQRFQTTNVAGADWTVFFLLAVLLFLFGVGMGRFVNVNRFSLHGLYRNRLVRAYLGASNARRNPDPFTGFALDDNIKMRDLWSPPNAPEASRRPMHVVNTTLNLVRGSKLAWQERKAESFSITPFHCGNFHDGYRRSHEYGGPSGITLGTALTISGAAANPNMGYHSSPPITFLLGILNGRLGAWLGNTNARGNSTFMHQGPRWAVRPLFAELFGLTSSTTKYVQLSDGGHFDNLGLYEMVLRRCRLIVVSDAGRDPSIGFEDLGNAIRKIRIDFGVSIDFQERIRIVARAKDETGLYCAIGTINYQKVDGQQVSPGTLIYLKPTLKGEGDPLPYDVVSYSNTPKTDFPHESTADQWFDESQFESYRALGRHVLEQITAKTQTPIQSLQDFEYAVQRYVQVDGKKAPAPVAKDADVYIERSPRVTHGGEDEPGF
jgi:hypothetical protein